MFTAHRLNDVNSVSSSNFFSLNVAVLFFCLLILDFYHKYITAFSPFILDFNHEAESANPYYTTIFQQIPKFAAELVMTQPIF